MVPLPKRPSRPTLDSNQCRPQPLTGAGETAAVRRSPALPPAAALVAGIAASGTDSVPSFVSPCAELRFIHVIVHQRVLITRLKCDGRSSRPVSGDARRTASSTPTEVSSFSVLGVFRVQGLRFQCGSAVLQPSAGNRGAAELARAIDGANAEKWRRRLEPRRRELSVGDPLRDLPVVPLRLLPRLSCCLESVWSVGGA